MRIVLATPLYPPDIEEPAPYIKELARRLATNHTITIVTYGHLSEKIPGVTIIAIDKRRLSFLRIITYTAKLYVAARKADIVYAENGPSVELPASIVQLVTQVPLVIHIGDTRASMLPFSKFIKPLLFFQAHTVVTDSPIPKPEILPLEEHPFDLLETWNASWKMHVRSLENIFTHG